MKNKYQEALDRLSEKAWIHDDLNDDEYCDKNEKLLQELVEKETLKKPSKDTDDGVIFKYHCPNCGERLNSLKKYSRCIGPRYYKPRYDEFGCGQKIDWSDDK